MKIRQGFVSNSSTSSYIYMVSKIDKNTSQSIIDEIKSQNYLYNDGRNDLYFAHKIYDGYDDAFYYTDFDKVDKEKKAYLKMYKKYKDSAGLDVIKLCNDVAYDERWFKSIYEEEYNKRIDDESDTSQCDGSNS